jgi:hypothetical protein
MKIEDIYGPSHNQLPFVPHSYHYGHHHDCPCNLQEATYKEISLLIDPNFLDLSRRANEVKGVNLESIDHNTLHFKTALTASGNRYINLVRFKQWDEVVSDFDWTPMEAARVLIWKGDVELHCSCPAFLYWGFQYLLTSIDASIIPEERKPRKNNPMEKGIVCKHLYRTLKSFPFFGGDIAQEIKRQRNQGGQQ